MKGFFVLVALYFACCGSWAKASKMVCYYDTKGPTRPGPAKFTIKDMEVALQFCSYMIYSHAIITPEHFAVKTLAHQQEQEFLNISKLKIKYRNVKFLLSISGHQNVLDTENILHLLEAGPKAQQTFVTSALQMLRKYQFDGLSLDLPLPTKKPKHKQTYFADLWRGIRKVFSTNSVQDLQSSQHKKQLTDLIHQLKSAVSGHNLLLSLTVLPNVKSKLYFNTEEITKNLDFIILSAFDFHTPERNPEEADYSSPLYTPIKTGERLPQTNVHHLVEEWLKALQVPSHKLILGIASFGRSWTMTNITKMSAVPPVMATFGPGPAGLQTRQPGLLSWPEICSNFSQRGNETKTKTPKLNPLNVVVDPTKKYGNYAYRRADSIPGNMGLWISYEDPLTAAAKADYSKRLNLGGVALFDITLDDLRGHCHGIAYPMLKSILIHLVQ